jgi:hypothetical protein
MPCTNISVCPLASFRDAWNSRSRAEPFFKSNSITIEDNGGYSEAGTAVH